MEDKILEIVMNSLQVKCNVYNVVRDAYITTLYMYPLPNAGDIIHTYLDNNSWLVVRREFHEKTDVLVDYNVKEWDIYVEQIKFDYKD